MKEVNLLKRIVYAVLAVILVLGTTTSALAAENGMIRPNYVGVSSIKPVITLASNGTVVCSDRVTTKAGYTAKVTWSCQYQNNKSWVPVASWNNSGKTLLLNKTVAVVGGRTYRLQTVAMIYDSNGKLVETATKVSEYIRT